MKKPTGPTKPKTPLSIDRDLWKRLRLKAVEQGRPAYQILDDLIRAYLKKGAR